MDPKLLAIIIFAIDRAFEWHKQSQYTEEERKERARKEAIKFLINLDQMQTEIDEYTRKA